MRDGVDIFGGPIVDANPLSGGTVALHSWYNSGANFDNVQVHEVVPGTGPSLFGPMAANDAPDLAADDGEQMYTDGAQDDYTVNDSQDGAASNFGDIEIGGQTIV